MLRHTYPAVPIVAHFHEPPHTRSQGCDLSLDHGSSQTPSQFADEREDKQLHISPNVGTHQCHERSH